MKGWLAVGIDKSDTTERLLMTVVFPKHHSKFWRPVEVYFLKNINIRLLHDYDKQLFVLANRNLKYKSLHVNGP